MSKRYKEISDFIRNGEQSRIIESKFSNRYNTMYVKSRITDRFYSIYREDSTDTFFSDNLKFIAIYDREEDRLFNVDYSFEYDIKQGDFDIELSEMDFGKIKKEIYSKINHKIQDYAISYAETLKIEAYDDYMNQEEYIFKHHKESSEKYFLTHCCDYLLEDSSLLN